MNNSRFLAALLLAFPLAAAAQTTTAPAKPSTAPAATTSPSTAPAPPPPGMQQVTEVTEDLDPATGKVIRRTTRTVNVPAGTVGGTVPATPAPAAAPTPSNTPTTPNTTAKPTTTAKPSTTSPSTPVPSTTATLDNVRATDAQVTTFLGRKTAVATLTGPALIAAYNRFLEKVRADRHNWRAANWDLASAVMSSLNARYEQLRPNLSFDDKLTVRSSQAEYQALRTARQLSDQVSDKL